MLRPILLAVVLFGLCRPDPAAAQDSAAPMFLTLDQALQYAADHYPTVRAALEQVNASAAGVNLAKTA